MLRALFPRRGLVVEKVSGPDAFGHISAVVTKYHRHHEATVGWMWGLMAWNNGDLVGVGVVGHATARLLMQRGILEVTRVCTFSRKRYGAASAIYKAASANAGASPIITYTLASEAGVSLSAAGWHDEGIAGGGKWNRGCATPDHLTGKKRRWCDRIR